jgi:hypothetical protein
VPAEGQGDRWGSNRFGCATAAFKQAQADEEDGGEGLAEQQDQRVDLGGQPVAAEGQARGERAQGSGQTNRMGHPGDASQRD